MDIIKVINEVQTFASDKSRVKINENEINILNEVITNTKKYLSEIEIEKKELEKTIKKQKKDLELQKIKTDKLYKSAKSNFETIDDINEKNEMLDILNKIEGLLGLEKTILKPKEKQNDN